YDALCRGRHLPATEVEKATHHRHEPAQNVERSTGPERGAHDGSELAVDRRRTRRPTPCRIGPFQAAVGELEIRGDRFEVVVDDGLKCAQAKFPSVLLGKPIEHLSALARIRPSQ